MLTEGHRMIFISSMIYLKCAVQTALKFGKLSGLLPDRFSHNLIETKWLGPLRNLVFFFIFSVNVYCFVTRIFTTHNFKFSPSYYKAQFYKNKIANHLLLFIYLGITYFGSWLFNMSYVL